MRFSKSWIIAMKDFKTFRRKRVIIYSTFLVPLIISIAITVVVKFAGHKYGSNGIPAAGLLVLLPAFAFIFIILAAYVPATIASYTLVGEKVEKSLEPLLAAPVTDGEILLGKMIAAFLPALGSVWGGSALFMVLMDLTTHVKLGYYYFPNWSTAIILLLVTPLTAMMSVQFNIIISSRVSDVRASQQLGAMSAVPLIALYVLGELNIVSLGSDNNLLIIAAIIMVADIALFYLTRAIFQREEILTRWR